MFNTTIIKQIALILTISISTLINASVDDTLPVQNASTNNNLIDLEEKLKNWKSKINQYYSDRFLQIDEQLASATRTLHDLNNGSYKGSTYKVVQDWRRHIDKLHTNIIGTPPANPFSETKLISEEELEIGSELHQRYNLFYNEYLKFTREIDQNQERYSRSYLDVLGLLSKCRASILNRSNDSDYKVYFSLRQVIRDIKREILILPKVYQTSWQNKLTEIKHSLQIGGLKGYYVVVSELIIWILFSIFIIFAARRFDIFQEKVEAILDSLIEKLDSAYKISKILVYVLEVFSRSATWVLLFFSSLLLKELLKHSLFFEFELPLTALEIYCYYKIAFVALRYSLVKLKTSALLNLSYATQLRLLRDFSSLLKMAFISILLLSSINFFTSKSILFQVTFVATIILLLGQVIYIMNQWKVNLYKHLSHETSSSSLNIVRTLLRIRFLSALIVPFVAIVLLSIWLFSHIYYELQRFEWVKKVSAKILILKARRHATNSEQTLDKSAPNVYTNQVLASNDIPLDMFVDRTQYYEILDYINASQTQTEGSLNNTLVISGTYGAGKTTFLYKLAEHFSDNYNVVFFDLESECKKDPGLDSISFLFQDLDPTLKHIIFVDNFHKCFLPNSAYKKILQEITSKSIALGQNLFLCLSVQATPWKHQENTIRLSNYFSKTLHLSRFNYDEMKQLIEKRHKRTKYKVSFAEIALKDERLSTIKDHESKALEQLLKIIWEKSGKSPRLALHLWCECLSADGDNALTARYPKDLIPTLLYKNLDTDSLFILSSLLRYHAMSFKEFYSVLGDAYSEEQLRLKLTQLCRKNIVLKDIDGSYFFNPWVYRDLLQYLEVKGYVT